MTMLTEQMKDLINHAEAWVLATADSDGVPNAIPVNWCELIDDDTMMLVDNCMKKTVENIMVNPNVAISIWEGSVGYQFKGKARIETSGEVFEEGEKIVKMVNPTAHPKGVIIVDIETIYNISPGQDAGKQLVDGEFVN
ncbi:MAG: hypothetical protein HGB11_01250 [Chlorobiales bacterium]|nr:hypothetical protein [Chlorobiales bacterium]